MRKNNREQLTIKERQKVYRKFNGRCAYCGKKIAIRDMQVDHILPLHKGGENSPDNYNPACSACNTQKGMLTVEQFRSSLQRIQVKLYKDKSYRLALRYGLIEEKMNAVTFLFEEV